MADSNNTENSEIGNSYGDWKILRRIDTRRYMCVCEPCGTTRDVDIRNLRSGRSSGCGCQRKARAKQRKIDETNMYFEQQRDAEFNAAVDAELARVQAQEDELGMPQNCRIVRGVIERQLARKFGRTAAIQKEKINA